MKSFFRFFAVLTLVMCTVFGCYAGNNNKKKVNKNDTYTESKPTEFSGKGWTAKMSFMILIDNEVSTKDVNLRIGLFSRDRSSIRANGRLVIGRKGDTEDDTEQYDEQTSHKEVRTDNFYACIVTYSIDVEKLFNSNKVRLETENGVIDIDIDKKSLRELKTKYENALDKADEIYNVKTDIMHNF